MNARLTDAWSRFTAQSPLRHRLFRLVYVGSIGTALGYTMQTTVAAWVMATLTTSTWMVALVQTASTLPALLFGLVAGALADIVDRRRLILVTQVLLLAATLMLGLLTLSGLVGPGLLLALTFLVGAGLSLYLPAQQASTNDLVDRDELPRAVALGAVAFNLARAVGPALAGGIAAAVGSGSAMLAASLCFTLMIVAALRMPRRERTLPGVPETVLSGVMSGLRFARHSPAMRALVARNVSFSVCAAAFWALLPVIARDQLQLGAGGYGVLSAGFGVGAIVGALVIPGQLQRRSLQAVVTAGAGLWVLAIGLVAVANHVAPALVGAFGCGAAWVSVLASLSAGTQSSAPAWVRARAVSVNLVANQVSLALGSAVWGAVALALGIRLTLATSAVALLVLLVVGRRMTVAIGNESDVTPGARLPELVIAVEPGPQDGPVLIQIRYQVDAPDRAAFLRAIHAVEPVRRRNGAVSWRVFRDLAEDGVYVERFVIESWAEFVRVRARATVADRVLLQQAEQLQRPGVPVGVSRFIGVDRDEPSGVAAAPRGGA